MNERFVSRHPDPATSPGLALWRATNAWQRTIHATLKPHGLTHTQFVLLATLAASPPEHRITQSVLANEAETDHMMTSNVLRTLETKGLLTRSTDPHDRRAILLAITPAGLTLVNAANQDVEAADEKYFSPLRTAQRTELIQALHRVRGRER